MKILSKHKDYYDHLVSHYGFDKHIVYDRRNQGKFTAPKVWGGTHSFAICGEIFPLVNKKGRFVFDAQDKDLDYWEKDFLRRNFKKPTEINIKYRQPVVLFSGKGDFESVGIPLLKEWGFAAQIPANEMYERIYAFLSWLKDNPEPPNTQTNKEKIIAHGLCPKTSFRPLIKNC